MAKLVCNIDSCKAIKDSINILITKYNELLQSISSLEAEGFKMWKSEAEVVYHKKFDERKQDLDNLSLVYGELSTFLDKAFSSYESIESKYR